MLSTDSPWSDREGHFAEVSDPAAFLGVTPHEGPQEACPDERCREAVARQRAEAEAAARYDARLAVAVVLPVAVVRYQCPHCRKTRARKDSAQRHVARCFRNPDVRSCVTCEHHEPEESGTSCEGGRPCGCWDSPEACGVRPSSEQPAKFPVIDCPLWEARTD
ncbi:hypothetical protein ACIP9H_33405 [Streptomyces sp. NPDC088732]|uniref:hypothetical protein n=1 Tax=Streptomyces sp. NPDC088732 TaxID=3365879 RepID=UPI00382DC767